MSGKGDRVQKPFVLPPEDWSPGDPEPFAAKPSIHANRWTAPTLPAIQRDTRQRDAFKAQLPEGQTFMEQQPAHFRDTLYNNLGPTWGAVPEGVPGLLGIADWLPGAGSLSASDDLLYDAASGDPARLAEEGAMAAANIVVPHIAGKVIKGATKLAKPVLQSGREALTQLMHPRVGGSSGRR